MIRNQKMSVNFRKISKQFKIPDSFQPLKADESDCPIVEGLRLTIVLNQLSTGQSVVSVAIKQVTESSNLSKKFQNKQGSQNNQIGKKQTWSAVH